MPLAVLNLGIDVVPGFEMLTLRRERFMHSIGPAIALTHVGIPRHVSMSPSH